MADLDDLEAIARRRRSVRAFLPEPVERAVIERAIAVAATAPSSCNTQPWRIHVTAGAATTRVREALLEAARQGAPRTPEVAEAEPYRDVYRARQIDAAVRLFEAQGVARHDRAARTASFLRNYAFFGAPHVAFVFIPPGGGSHEAADCGKFAQTFMLALAAAGIGSCPQGSLADYPDVVRRTLALDEPGRLLFGISFGHADPSDPTARVRPPRQAVSSLAVFHDDGGGRR